MKIRTTRSAGIENRDQGIEPRDNKAKHHEFYIVG
jgi:hypothetical protein